MADGPIASRLHVFMDKENTSGLFDETTEPETIDDAITLWTEAFVDGIKEMMSVSNSLGIGKPGLLGIDDAFSAEFTKAKIEAGDWWAALDTTIDTMANNIVDNSAQGTMAMAGFTETVNPPSATFDTAASASAAIDAPRHGDPVYKEGIIATGSPPVNPPPGSPCARHSGGPEPEEGTAPELDNGYDLANRLEDFTIAYLDTAVAHIMTSPPPANIPIPVPGWLIPSPSGGGAKKSHTIRDLVDDVISPVDKNRLNPSFEDEDAEEGEGVPLTDSEQEDLFKMLVLVLELCIAEDTDDSEDQNIKNDSKDTAKSYLDEMITHGAVEKDSSLGEYDHTAYEFAL